MSTSTTRSLAAIGLALFAAMPALAYDFPDGIPERKPGLWELVTTGTVGPNRVHAIQRYCLDARADRALREVQILGMELSVVYMDISCPAPKISLSGKVLSGAMDCRSNAPDDGDAAGTDFRWKTTFESDREIVREERSVARDVLFAGTNDLVQRQTWIGECPAGQKPGDGVDFGFTYNAGQPPADERPDNLYRSLERGKRSLAEAKAINQRLGPM